MAKLTLTDLASLQNETSSIAAINSNNTAIETALENTLSRDGTSPNTMGASLDMNNNRILNLPTPISNTEPLRVVDALNLAGLVITPETAASILTKLLTVDGSGSGLDADLLDGLSSAAFLRLTGDVMTGNIKFSGTGHAGIYLNVLTSAQRTALGAIDAGALVWNSTTTRPEIFNSSTWLGFSILSLANTYTSTQLFASTTNLSGEPFKITAGWNNAGADFYGLALDVDNGSGGAPVNSAASRLFDYRVNGSSMFAVNTSGNLWVNNNLFLHFYNTHNTALGINTFTQITATSAQNNVAMGSQALRLVTTGDSNTAFGADTLSAVLTTAGSSAFGFQALNVSTGADNSAFGNQALVKNTSGTGLVGMGAYSLDGNTTGSNNTGCGLNTGYMQQTGSLNTFVGYRAGRGEEPTNYNSTSVTGVGAECFRFLRTGCDNNTGLGFRAGYNILTGANNVLIGFQAGDVLTTGNGNIIIGYDIDPPANNSADVINIGGRFRSLTDGTFILSNAAGTGFTNLMLGASGTTYHLLKHEAAGILGLKLADDSAYSTLRALRFQSTGSTVAALPAAGTAGRRGHVTDSNAALTAGIGAVVAGGGANVVPVFDDGTNWRIG